MARTILKSYSKVNLFLNVGKKNIRSRLHNVQSLVCLINIYDKIVISRIRANRDIVKFSGKFSTYVHKKKNSIIKCLLLLRSKGIIKKNQNFKVTIQKNIPVFSGLGGGSSNSATLIKYFGSGRKFYEKDISSFSRNLGSDCRLFFGSNQIFQKNINKIINIKKKLNFYLVVVYPFLKSSTKEVYSKIKFSKNLKQKSFDGNRFQLKTIDDLKYEENFLERIVIGKFPVIQKILYQLETMRNCQFSRVTGSGSACFGLFLTKRSADLALRKIKKKFPKCWCVVGKTI